MTRVILPVGPQFAGKSTFCEKVAEAFPSTTIISRDKILIEMFGTVWLDNYCGGHYAGMARLWKEVKKFFADPTPTLILDLWNAEPLERCDIVQKLKTMGAARVEAWHFITPLKECLEWSFIKMPFEHKPGNRWNEISHDLRVDNYTRIHKTFFRMDLEGEKWFDKVRRINALSPIPKDLLAA